MGVLRYKIWNDLWANKPRTFQVVLIIAVGAFAVGMIIATRNLIVEGMQQSWLQSSPAMISMAADTFLDEETIRGLQRIDGLVAVEAFASAPIEWRLDDDDEWMAAELTTHDDYNNQKFFKLQLNDGTWPTEDVLAMGQGTDTVFGASQNGQVILRINDREYTYTVGGIVSDPTATPPGFGGNAQFFASRDAFAELFNTQGYNYIRVSAANYDEEKVTALANRISERLERQDVDTFGHLPPTGSRIIDPSKHFFQDTMDGVFLVLGVMAVMALILGLFLVYNTIKAIIAQQVDQIGILKAVGASTAQVLRLYMSYVLAFGVLALLIAVPLGIITGWFLTVFLANTFNADPGPFRISPPALWAQIIIAILAPLIVALGPVIGGARVSVREAISTYGLAVKPSLLDRLITHIKNVSRLFLLTVGNTFRDKGRVILTEITLVLSGLIFMMVISVGDSATHTFNDVLFSILNSNINLVFRDAERIGRIESLTMQHPGVQNVEMWGFGNGNMRLQTEQQTDDDPSVVVFGVPPDTAMYGHQIREGRWLAEGDGYAVVLNQKLAQDLDVGVGDWITINQGVAGDSDWSVVGLSFDPLLPNTVHVPRATLLREQNSVDRAHSVWIQLKQDNAATEQIVVRQLRELYESNGIVVLPGGGLGQDTSSEVVENINSQMRPIIFLLGTMAVLMGIVGSISLSGVLSLSVIERQREIGVLRAIGASSWDVARLFVGEALILGWLSWIIAFPLSLPAGRVMTQALSAALGSEIVYYYSPRGAFIWLTIVTGLSILASWLPARRATHLSVRESLLYF